MALPTNLGPGGAGWHGDQAVSVRATLKSLVTLVNELKTDHNGTLAKLDLDTGAADADYASLHSTAAAAAAAVPAELGLSGSFLHGDDGVKTRKIIDSIGALANELKADHNATLTKLDADGGVGGATDTNYAALHTTATADAGAPLHAETTWGGARLAPGQVIQAQIKALITLVNELKADHNGLVAKLDADSGITDTNYAALHGTSAADAA